MQNDGTPNDTENGKPAKLSPDQILSLRNAPPLCLSRQEAAFVANLSLRTVSALIAKRAIKTVRVGDRRIVRLRDLEAFLEKHVV